MPRSDVCCFRVKFNVSNVGYWSLNWERFRFNPIHYLCIRFLTATLKQKPKQKNAWKKQQHIYVSLMCGVMRKILPWIGLNVKKIMSTESIQKLYTHLERWLSLIGENELISKMADQTLLPGKREFFLTMAWWECGPVFTEPTELSKRNISCDDVVNFVTTHALGFVSLGTKLQAGDESWSPVSELSWHKRLRVLLLIRLIPKFYYSFTCMLITFSASSECA